MTSRYLMAMVWMLAPLVARAQAPEETPPTVLTLSPVAEPVPAMKYRLLPDLREQTPGNAIMLYHRASSTEWHFYRNNKNWPETIDKALEGPLKDMPVKDVAWLRESWMMREVDRAARRVNCDWELSERIREEGFRLLLPDVQEMRQRARMLAVRARLELADRNFDQAAYSLRTGFALARHTGDGPTLIHGLVAVASAMVMTGQVETWIQIPNSPSLYWALTDLPTPFIDFRKPLQGERIMLDNILPGLRECLADPTRPAKSVSELHHMVKKIAEVSETPKATSELSALVIAAKYPEAKRFLGQHGWTAAQIDAVPAMQAVLMHEAFEYDRFFDGYAKAANLPYPQAQALMRQVMVDLGATFKQPIARPILAGLWLPAVERVFASKARLDRQIAVLRVIEAIRLHAAANGGKLPVSLAAITIVPVPLDPALGVPFSYTLNGDKASLTSEAPPGSGLILANRLRYELTIGK
jgi:hypothetical protein